MQKVQRPSLGSLLLEMTWNGKVLATGTGFVARLNGGAFLVTNRHNLAGRRSDDDSLLSSRGVTPDSVTIHHNGVPLGTWVPVEEPVTDAAGRPLWFEHPVYGKGVDVVALPLTVKRGIVLAEYDLRNPGPDVAFPVSQDVSIVGFPFGITGGGKYPIWIRGSIATEPSIDFDGLPCLLVDSRTRPGQSGSPVIYHSSAGMVPMADGSSAMFSGPVTRFLGVYSGRISSESDLGYVWKVSAVRETLEAAEIRE